MQSSPKPRNARSLTNAMLRLKREHRRLDQLIVFEDRLKAPDSLKLQRLKRLRLAVKEKLQSLEQMLRAMATPVRPQTA